MLKVKPKCELCPCGCGQPLKPGQKHHSDNTKEHEYHKHGSCACCEDEEGHEHGSCSCCEEEEHGGIEKSVVIRLSIGAVIYAAALIFGFPPVLKLLLFIAAYLVIGGEVLLRAGRNILRGRVFDENFLMSIATIGAFVIGEYPEAVAVMLFYQVGELFQSFAVGRSRRSIAKLMDIRPEYANLKKDNTEKRVSPEEVSVGDIIIVRPGERIPLDGSVVSGDSYADTSALTGESEPRRITSGDTVYSGSINQNGVIEIKVEKAFSESAVSKILELVENASSRKAPTENFISRFAAVYTPIVVGLAAVIAVFPPLFGWGSFSEWVGRALIFLVISCPCALVISIPLGFFGGIGAASRAGVLVKGSNYLEILKDIRTVVFDKTGTLTRGVFSVSEVRTFSGFSSDDVLEAAAYAESNSNHPIAKSIMKAYADSGKTVDSTLITGYEEISGLGIKATVKGKEVLSGSAKLLENQGVSVPEDVVNGTTVYIAVDGKAAGAVCISDEIKPDAAKAIKGLKESGITRTVMLTGDRKETAERVARKLGVDEYRAELMPQDKVSIVEEIMSEGGGKVAFIGDGINDAPVLARADLGIAMGGLGSDAAIEAADIVIMNDEPSRLLAAIRIARKTKRIVAENIVFALAVKIIVMTLGAGGLASLWEAVIADVGVALLAVFNSLRAMRGTGGTVNRGPQKI